MSDPFNVSDDPVLSGLQNAMQYNTITGQPEIRVNIGQGIDITGPVNIPGEISVVSSGTAPVSTHIRQVGTSGLLTTPYLPVSISNFPATQPVSIDTLPSIAGTVSISNFPATQPVSLASLPSITGTVSVSNFPATQPVSVAALPPITGTVVVSNFTAAETGQNFSVNNHAINSNRGWTIDNTMRPVISFRVNTSSAADLARLIDYEIGSNSNNQSTVIYEWYEGDMTIEGADLPGWINLGDRTQYRIYEDIFGSNESNTFRKLGVTMRHSGILIGRNVPGEAGPINIHGGSPPNMLTLCMKRVDSGTKIDFWFAFTVKELS